MKLPKDKDKLDYIEKNMEVLKRYNIIFDRNTMRNMAKKADKIIEKTGRSITLIFKKTDKELKKVVKIKQNSTNPLELIYIYQSRGMFKKRDYIYKASKGKKSAVYLEENFC